MKPILDSERWERQERPRPPDILDHIVDTPHPSLANGEQNVDKPELGSPGMISDYDNALDKSCGPTDADQPYVQSERQNDPGDQLSSHERLPTIERSGSTEALDSASGEPDIHSDGPGLGG